MPRGRVPAGEAPWGYVVTVPFCPNQRKILEDVNGYIIRTKKKCGNLLLQVVVGHWAPSYGIKAEQKNKKKKNPIMSIVNLEKSDGESDDMYWGKPII